MSSYPTYIFGHTDFRHFWIILIQNSTVAIIFDWDHLSYWNGDEFVQRKENTPQGYRLICYRNCNL